MLPPPSDKTVFWKDYQIDTPTFELSPVEKPDMSPFLIHMTGKSQIKGILEAGDINSGMINSCIPSQGQSDWYEEKVVCFTDSPIFALDAFRHIKFDRWKGDQRFGIGFFKSSLVKHGVRPVAYIDEPTLGLIKKIRTANEDGEDLINELIDKILPIIFPLGESSEKQGFMWEREWRFCHSKGFIFQYSDIEVICCPEEEVEEITAILGEYSLEIKIVQAWDQYEDITRFISGQSEKWVSKVAASDKDMSEDMKFLLHEQRTLSKLMAYENYLSTMLSKLDKVKEERAQLEAIVSDTKDMLVRSGELEYDPKVCYECKCEFTDTITEYELKLDNDVYLLLCLDCYAMYMT